MHQLQLHGIVDNAHLLFRLVIAATALQTGHPLL
jgi:hypothetical protein